MEGGTLRSDTQSRARRYSGQVAQVSVMSGTEMWTPRVLSARLTVLSALRGDDAVHLGDYSYGRGENAQSMKLYGYRQWFTFKQACTHTPP